MNMKTPDVSDLKQHGGNDAVLKLMDAAQAPPDLEEVRPPEFSDDALALDFADRQKRSPLCRDLGSVALL
jgi:hypothetical protein